MGVRSLVWDHPLEEGMASHFSIIAWRTSWTEEFWRATVCRVANSWAMTGNSTAHTHNFINGKLNPSIHLLIHKIGAGNSMLQICATQSVVSREEVVYKLLLVCDELSKERRRGSGDL